MDEVSVKGLKLFGFHGCHPEEVKTGGRFEIDIHVESDMAKAIAGDNVEHAIDYVILMTIAKKQMQIRCNLIETVAANIAQEIKAVYSNSVRISVTVKKMSPPVSFEVDHVSTTFRLN
jgi:7,8-dihydroneopterin aldolase/epimerase/oxygenase